MKSTKLLGAIGVTVGLLATAGVQAADALSPNPACAALQTPVYQAVNPHGSSLFTVSSTEAAAAKTQGYTDQLGAAFGAARTASSGLVPVRRLANKTTKDFLYTSSASEVSSAISRYGYVDEGIRFYAAAAKTTCNVGVTRFVKGTQHRLAGNAAEAAALLSAGWRSEGIRFYVAPVPLTDPNPGPTVDPVIPDSTTPPSDTFKFAVIPDTQVEVLKSTDTRMASRNRWLVQQNVSFVTQTGDLVNWDTPEHEQYARAKSAMDVLTTNRKPYTVAVGNHDTAATGVGGSAAPGKTWELVRDTRTLNSYFKASDFGSVSGAFEPGKIDNVYATYTAGGKKWMVITLEFCAREAVVEWARRVVAGHPDHNVIFSTHYYLSSGGGIPTDRQGYGSTSPKYVYDRLISQYPNIKMVFSGHVGVARKARVDTGVHGNKIHSFLTTFHEGETNPVRVLSVNTKTNTVSSRIFAPHTNKSWTTYDQTITGLNLR